MKLPKLKNTIFAVTIVFTGIAAFSYGISTGVPVDAGSGFRIQVPRPESLKGTTELNFVSADDNRVWHIVNNYSALESAGSPAYNTSSYFFGKDSVCIINEYAGVPDQNPLNIGLAQSISNAISFHN
jgi:hypothetical protein